MADIKKIKKASNYIKNEFKQKHFDVAIIFGSGLSPSESKVSGKKLQYKNIPGFPLPSIKGHAGELIYKNISNKNILFFLGRIHNYEGYSMDDTTFPIRLSKELGVKTMILTNSAGSINKSFKPGDLMIIKDHINLMGTNPLIGPNIDDHGTRFPDMTYVYSQRLITLLKKVSNIKFKEGVYVGVLGPSYDTPAEINFYRMAGGDAVGMSTVHEAIVAKHCDMEILGISFISNSAADINKNKLDHNEVIKLAKKCKAELTDSLLDLIGEL